METKLITLADAIYAIFRCAKHQAVEIAVVFGHYRSYFENTPTMNEYAAAVVTLVDRGLLVVNPNGTFDWKIDDSFVHPYPSSLEEAIQRCLAHKEEGGATSRANWPMYYQARDEAIDAFVEQAKKVLFYRGIADELNRRD